MNSTDSYLAWSSSEHGKAEDEKLMASQSSRCRDNRDWLSQRVVPQAYLNRKRLSGNNFFTKSQLLVCKIRMLCSTNTPLPPATSRSPRKIRMVRWPKTVTGEVY